MDSLAQRVAQRFAVSAGHPQTFVKVNVAVDVGVAAVVQALSEIPNVSTISSCQGEAYVAFVCSKDMHGGIEFYDWLLWELFRRLRRNSFSLVIYDVLGHQELRFRLVFHPSLASEIAAAITDIAHQVQGSFS